MSNALTIFQVSELNACSRLLLEKTFADIYIEGELSNLTLHPSGHWYFTLKDDKAQIRCAMFKMQNARVAHIPKHGDHVLLKARVSLYEARGDYQLIVSTLEDKGYGALQRAFEALKQKLLKEGLFDATHKKPLPTPIHTVGIISSDTGAALQDILITLKRRQPLMHIIIYPSLVQGAQAAASLVEKIKCANTRAECDVLILARGGGSLEDLCAFNDETVARAIYHSALPIITGIGHETDITIADFVADERAATPTAAAERVSSDQQALRAALTQHLQQLTRNFHIMLQQLKNKWSHQQARLLQQHPQTKIRTHQQHLDTLLAQLVRLQQTLLLRKQHAYQQLHAALLARMPALQPYYWQLNSRLQDLKKWMLLRLQQEKFNLGTLAESLQTLSPLHTLARGYSITLKNNIPVTDIKSLKTGDKIETRLTNGKIISIVSTLEK